jgi:riboflavin kinase / FMN adenylyltransferase
MQVLHGMDALRSLPPIGAASIGNFDGVHLGHARILREARQLAQALPVCVITFEPHPLTVLRPHHAPPRLLDLNAKHKLLADAGADYLIELAPSPKVLGVTAEQFWQIIRDDLKPKHLIEGADFHFGRGRAGTIALLREWSNSSEVELHIVDSVEASLVDMQIVSVSSSLIRWLVGNGRMRDAITCLGRPYTLTSTVVKGFQRGREMGMPTANLRIHQQVIPMEGVYAGRCWVENIAYSAAISVGRPLTFETAEFQIEAHLIGFSGDLYGQTLHLEFLDWLRDQRKYANADALKAQMDRDVELIGSMR